MYNELVDANCCCGVRRRAPRRERGTNRAAMTRSTPAISPVYTTGD